MREGEGESVLVYCLCCWGGGVERVIVQSRGREVGDRGMRCMYV